jgi:ISSag4, transposase orfA
LLDKWLKQSAASGFFHEKDNRSAEEQEIIGLRKLNRQLKI